MDFEVGEGIETNIKSFLNIKKWLKKELMLKSQ